MKFISRTAKEKFEFDRPERQASTIRKFLCAGYYQLLSTPDQEASFITKVEMRWALGKCNGIFPVFK